jgi:hypothetical protein
MRSLVIVVLRGLLVLAAIGSVLVQVVMLPLLANDLDDDFGAEVAAVEVPVVILLLLGIGTVQVMMACVWRLLTMVRTSTVISPAAFRHVDVIIGAFFAAAVVVFALGAVLAPGEAVAPGVVLLVGGAGGLVTGVALLVLVLRMVLAQAIDRDVEANLLRSELDEVI